MSGSLPTGTSTQSYTPTPPPWATGLLQQGATQAQAAAQTNPYAQPGVQQNVAGFNPGMWNQVAPSLSGIAAYQPQQVQAQQVGSQNVGSQNVYAQDVAGWAGGTGIGHLSTNGMDLSGYLNPYTQDVIAQSDKDITRQSQIQQQANSGQAAMAGAFGGDRAAIVNTETQRNAADTMARTNAGLNAANFAQAQGQANTDLNRQLQGATSQTQLGLQASQANQQAALQAGLANQAAALRAAQGNQTAALQAGQGNQYAGLQGQNLDLQGTTALGSLYGLDQATRQKYLDAQTTNATNQALWPTNSASWLLSQGQKLPYPSITSTFGTGTPAPPSTFGQIGGALTAGAGILGALGGTSGGLGALSTIGSGLKSGYNSLFGGSTFDANGIPVTYDTYSGLTSAGLNAQDASNSILQSGGAFDSAGNALFGPGFKRGGIVGYADGGSIDDRQWAWDHRGRRYRALTGDETGGQPTVVPFLSPDADAAPTPPAYSSDAADPGTVYDDTYAPVSAGRYGANLGIGRLQPEQMSQDVRDLLNTPSPDVSPAYVAGVDGDGSPAGASGQPGNAPSAASAPLPEPPMPPGGTPQGDPGSQGGPPKLTPPPQLAGAVQAVSPGIGAILQRQPNVLDHLNEGNTPAWMALIKAGAAMMSSRSPYAGVAIGEGLHVGADALTTAAHQQQQIDVQRQQAQALAAYRQGTLGVQQQRAATGDKRADTYGQVSAERIQLMQAQAQASLQRAQAAAAKTPGMTNAQITESAIQDMMQRDPTLSRADATAHIRGLDIRQQQADTARQRADTAADQGDRRLDLTAQRDQATQDNRVVVNNRNQVNDVVRGGLSLTNANPGTKLPDAIQQVQTQRGAVAASLPAGQGVGGLRAAAAGGGPVQVSTPQEAAALPPGTRFVTPDGQVRVRGGISQ